MSLLTAQAQDAVEPGAENSEYDLIAIGSGPAGEKGAFTAAVLGKRVALVEKDRNVGGASTNTGTIPSKTLRETALALSGFNARALYGVDLSLRREATVADLMYHEERVKTHERTRVLNAIHKGHIDLYRGTASFVDSHTVEVRTVDGETTRVRARFILIATGSSPVHPPGFDFSDPRILDSDTILSLKRLPKALAVVGAGVIGSEYACTFAALGCEVHLIDGRDVLLPFLDREVARTLEEAMGRLGVRFYWKESVTKCPRLDGEQVQLVCESGKELPVDAVLVAAGRSSNTAALNLSAAGLTPGIRGLINVDHHYQTEVPHIYAAGDVIGFPALAATSAEQARVAMCHAFDFPFKEELSGLLPTGIYTIPEVSMVGETEESLKSKKVDYVAGRAPYFQNARGQIIGDSTGFLKLLFDRHSMKLLGAHTIGEHATELIHVALMAMLTGSGAELFNQACFNSPTLGELYKYATYAAIQERELQAARERAHGAS
jgi:NAD(P) transhydrogenase